MGRARKTPAAPDPLRGPSPVIDGLTWLCDLPDEKLEWALPGMVPLHQLVLFQGEKEVGKSTVLSALIAAWTGGPQPPGWRLKKPGRVLIHATEDSYTFAIKPRLIMAGANLALVARIRPPGQGKRDRALALPGDIEWLQEVISKSKATLLVLDPLNGALSKGIDLHHDDGNRAVLAPLFEVAEEERCTMFTSRNLTKISTGLLIHRGQYGTGVANRHRVVLHLDQHPRDPGRKILMRAAGNYGRPPQSLVYRLVGKGEEMGSLEWDESELLDERSLGSRPTEPHEIEELKEADRVLYTTIARDWASVKTVQEIGKSAGVSEKALHKARVRLGCQWRQVWRSNENAFDWGPPLVGWPPSLVAWGVAQERGARGVRGSESLINRPESPPPSPLSPLSPLSTDPTPPEDEGGEEEVTRADS
jgi:AAA domain